MSSRKWYLRAFLAISVVALVAIGLGMLSGGRDPEFFQPQPALAAIRGDAASGDSGTESTIPLPQPKTPVAFVNVAVIPMTDDMGDSGRMLQAQTVIVEGDRITTIGPVSEIQIPEDATLVDGTGKYLLPGLTDMHVHIYSDDGVRDLEDLNPLYLNYGVTSIVSMNGNDELLRIRQKSRTQEVLWPTVYTASPVINPPAYSTPDEVERVRRQNKWDKRGAFKACNLDANRLRQFSDLPPSVRLDSFASPPVSSPVWRLAVRGTYPPA